MAEVEERWKEEQLESLIFEQSSESDIAGRMFEYGADNRILPPALEHKLMAFRGKMLSLSRHNKKYERFGEWFTDMVERYQCTAGNPVAKPVLAIQAIKASNQGIGLDTKKKGWF